MSSSKVQQQFYVSVGLLGLLAFHCSHLNKFSVHLCSSFMPVLQSWVVWASWVSLWFLHHVYLTCFLCWCQWLLSYTSWEHLYIFTLFSSVDHLAERARRRTTELWPSLWYKRRFGDHLYIRKSVLHSDCARRLSSCPKMQIAQLLTTNN